MDLRKSWILSIVWLNNLQFSSIFSGTVKQGLFPDYNNQTLIDAMVTLIRALGRQYDGDIRIGFWEIGFLGHWGEWHTFPNVSHFASLDHQDQILFAYNSSFVKTKLQLRYPHVSGNYNVTNWNVGFHDDSFFLDTYGEYWMFYNRSVVVGATQQWRKHVCFISTGMTTFRICFCFSAYRR